MRTKVAPDVLTIRWSLTWVKDDCRALHKHQQHVGFDFSLQDFWHKTDKTIDSTLQNMPNENVQIRSPLFLVLRESVHWTREAKRKSSCWRVECTDCSVHLWLTQLIVLQWRCWWPFFKSLCTCCAWSNLSKWDPYKPHRKLLLRSFSCTQQNPHPHRICCGCAQSCTT